MINKDSFIYYIFQQFNVELEDVCSYFLVMGGLVEKQVNDVVNVLIDVDFGFVQQVCEIDDQINQMECNIDEECVCIFVWCQLVVFDLCLIISILKLVIDFEWIGDEVFKVVCCVIQLCEEGELLCGYVEVWYIGSQVQKMVQEVLDVFVCFDVDLVLFVVQYDKIVDCEYKMVLCELVIYMMEDLWVIFCVFNIIWVLCLLECIGDYVCNIVELVIYLVCGIDVCYIGLICMKEEVENNCGE